MLGQQLVLWQMIKTKYFLGILVLLTSSSIFGQRFIPDERDSITLKTFEEVDSLINEKEYMIAFNKLYDLKQTALSSNYVTEFQEQANKVNTLSSLSVAINNVEISLRSYQRGKNDALILAQKFYLDALQMAPEDFEVKINSSLIENLPLDTINLNRNEGLPLNLYLVDSSKDGWQLGSKARLGVVIDSSLFQGVIASYNHEKRDNASKLFYQYSNGELIRKETYKSIYRPPSYRNKYWVLNNSEEFAGDAVIYYTLKGDKHYTYDTIIHKKNEYRRCFSEYSNGRCLKRIYNYNNAAKDTVINHTIYFNLSEEIQQEEILRTNKDSTFKITLNGFGDTLNYLFKFKGNFQGRHKSSLIWSIINGSYATLVYITNWDNGRLLSLLSENALFLNERGKTITEKAFIKKCSKTRNKRMSPPIELVLNDDGEPVTAFLVFEQMKNSNESYERKKVKSIEKHKKILLEEIEKK